MTPPDDATVEALLDLAGVAAHASERTAAPITCWLIGQAGVGVDEARRLADELVADLMRRTRFDDWDCPIARVTDLMGDWWTPLVLRECFYGRRRFDEFVDALGIPRPVLSAAPGPAGRRGAAGEAPVRGAPAPLGVPADRQGPRLLGRAGRHVALGHGLAVDRRRPPAGSWSTGRRATRSIPVVVDDATGEPLDIRKLRLRLRKPTTPGR